MSQKYYLDPDFRKDADPSKPFCVRCQKPIKDPKTAKSVTVDWNTWQVSEGGIELIGSDCWRIVKKNPVESK